MSNPASPLSTELRSALSWWQMAGVDHDFADDATDWLGPREEPAAKPTPQERQERPNEPPAVQSEASRKAVERIDLLGPNPPQDLAAFHKWWLEAPGLDQIGPRGRIAPRGVSNPELMVLVIDPEERDQDQLLNGPKGKLLSAMLGAMGIGDGEVYVASALPRHTPMADTQAIAQSGMDAVTAHHVGLVGPKRVLAFGSNILPLLGHEPTKDPASLREIKHEGTSVPLLVSEGLESMMGMPRLKARFWRRWMEWSAR